MQAKKKPLFLHQKSGFAPDNSLLPHAATSSFQRVGTLGVRPRLPDPDIPGLS
jgi:hypothetical protein